MASDDDADMETNDIFQSSVSSPNCKFSPILTYRIFVMIIITILYSIQSINYNVYIYTRGIHYILTVINNSTLFVMLGG